MKITYRTLQPLSAVRVSQPVGHVQLLELYGRPMRKSCIESKETM